MIYWIATDHGSVHPVIQRQRAAIPSSIRGHQIAMKATLDRLEGGSAILLMEGGQELIVPREDLPKNANEGSAFFLIFSESKTEEEHREKLAKSILNEILNNEV